MGLFRANTGVSDRYTNYYMKTEAHLALSGSSPRLLEQAALFGLGCADGDRCFLADEFGAAAITEVDIIFGGGNPWSKVRRVDVDVRFGRPFGFMAVNRPSRLVLVGG